MDQRQKMVRRSSSRNKRLIESYCPACRELIAASPQTRLLALLEKAHRCPQAPRIEKVQRPS
jgi:hypothetical protein